MHRLAATPGGWNSDIEGVVFIEQLPAPIVLLTAADTDISTLSQAAEQLPPDFDEIRSINLLQLQQQLTIDTYADQVLQHAQVIILRILGGRAYWSYGLEVAKATAEQTGAALIVIPGDDRPDLDLMGHSTVSLSVVNELWRYFTEGGVENLCNGFLYISDRILSTQYHPAKPKAIPLVGIYQPNIDSPLAPRSIDKRPAKASSASTPNKRSSSAPSSIDLLPKTIEEAALMPTQKSLAKTSSLPLEISVATQTSKVKTIQKTQQLLNNNSSTFLSDKSDLEESFKSLQLDSLQLGASVGILFYRAHYLSGNVKTIDAIAYHLQKRGLTPVPIYVSSLKDPDVQQALIEQCKSNQDSQPIKLLLNTTSFAIASLNPNSSAAQVPSLWETLDIPILQVICSGSPQSHWQQHPQGLTPRDIAMNVALPEVDGRIITRAVSFKAAQPQANSPLQTDVVTYEPVSDRIQFVTELAANWIHLRQTPTPDRKIALILANYPNRDGRMANGVGLDTPASCLAILQAMQAEGYTISDLPKTGDELMTQLASGITNDPESYGLRPAPQTLSLTDYQAFFAALPSAVQTGITQRWRSPEEEWQRFQPTIPTDRSTPALPIPGIQFGNIFVGIQPSRGYDLDPTLNYHAPDLAPTHSYMGFYHWLRHRFQAHACVHVGKHGNLEWLPGKGIALSENCYPEAAFGPMPHFYPFIVNDPGEGAQAKRRSQAVILDHLTPPMTRAELYGPLQQLESLVDEYYEAQNLDPTRLPIITKKIVNLLSTTHLQQDLNLTPQEKELPTWLPQIDGYLCELKEAQIRDGLHIYGQCPQGNQLRDLIVAIARHPSSAHIGLSRAIAQTWNLDIDPITADLAKPFQSTHSALAQCRTIGDAVEQIEQQAATLVEQILADDTPLPSKPSPLRSVSTWIQQTLLPNLKNTTHEIDHLLHGLSGHYVPSGPSGAPTRNRPEVLPTGRNFYSVDIRAIPTESAWDVGRKAAEILIENYTQENGEYPRTLGLSMWGTAAMRTGGDDMAEALALIGVRPVWDGPSRRVVDFEILPLTSLGRPRVDVTLRISGFFRDAFPNLISLFDQAVKAVSALDEPPEQNPLAAQVNLDAKAWQDKGLSEAQSIERSQYRIFGSKPGAYGAGLQGLIEAQNWDSDADLARAYINWSSYAYTGQADGRSAPEAFSQRLSQMQIVLQNQDNREHDILDSDDYYQFQGGLTAAVKTESGKAPVTYFGDNATPENPKVRSLKSEIARVYRARVVNPKWIAGVMRHGYKGAFEMSATVDYLFAYDATTGCVEDHMYEGVANAYVFDSAVREFVEKSNPWALRDMSERLLEAHQRGLWKGADEEMVDGLRAIAHEAEGQIETGLSNQS